MYASIDAVSDRLSRKLRKFKERREAGYHGGIKNLELNEALDAIELPEVSDELESDTFQDFGKPEVTKIRSFDLSKPITMEEAIFALDYVDHDFYVYRDAESGDVNVVYKRNVGGIGLIQPDQ
jgi:putative sigma-54 modulation protein